MNISTKLFSHLPLSPCKFLAPATSFGKESRRSVAWRSSDHGEELTLGIASAVSPGTCLQSTIYQGRGGLIFHSHAEIPKRVECCKRCRLIVMRLHGISHKCASVSTSLTAHSSSNANNPNNFMLLETNTALFFTFLSHLKNSASYKA